MADTKQRTKKDRKSEAPSFEAAFELEEKTIEIRRVSKVVQGGRRFAFRVTVVVGDHSGQVSVMQAVGVRDILTKSIGSNNIHYVVLATLDALDQLKSVDEQARLRGKDVKELKPFWDRGKKHGS